MRKIIVLLSLLPLFCIGQTKSNLETAIQLGDSMRYHNAISILKSEIKANPKNAEAYYWLGRYSHYIVYDTRPFVQKSDSWSKKEVLANLKKAIQLSPQMGDAYYFLAVEYGSRAREAIQQHDIKLAKKELLEAKRLEAFPEYVLEYARAILKSCESNAILFSNQDAAINSLMYVQLIEGLRKDISVVCVNLLERPFYIKYMRDGMPNEITKIPITWNNNLIMNMYSYFPWTQQNIQIKIADTKNNTKGEFTVTIKDKYGGHAMWIGTAAILNMLENNKFKRPIYCAMPYGDDMFEFTDYLQNEGIVSKFVTHAIKNFPEKFNPQKIESTLLNPDFYKMFSDIKFHNQPRVNHFFVDTRRNLILDYVEYLISLNDKKKAKNLLDKMNILMPQELAPHSSFIKNRVNVIEKAFE